MTAKRSKRGPTPLQLTFPPMCAATFAAPLAAHGFTAEAAIVEPTVCTQQYVAGARYIEVTASIDPRDAPDYCNVTLGEGRTDWPERDWNSVGLWRLIRDQASTLAEADAKEYLLGDYTELAEALRRLFDRMRADLFRYASDFLAGDVRAFRRVRAIQTRERSPYTVYEPDGRGGYVATVHPESAVLKERFSREDVN
jgi:hypothetical protein